jgi:hypothetical protein
MRSVIVTPVLILITLAVTCASVNFILEGRIIIVPQICDLRKTAGLVVDS